MAVTEVHAEQVRVRDRVQLRRLALTDSAAATLGQRGSRSSAAFAVSPVDHRV
ncbi:MAG: hypothetical protein ACRDQW_05210 [Haloechinothrix sp.]